MILTFVPPDIAEMLTNTQPSGSTSVTVQPDASEGRTRR